MKTEHQNKILTAYQESVDTIVLDFIRKALEAKAAYVKLPALGADGVSSVIVRDNNDMASIAACYYHAADALVGPFRLRELLEANGISQEQFKNVH
jgi:hypothetical protein